MKNLIEKSKKIVILPRSTFDVDLYASIVSLTHILKKMGKEVYISSLTKFPKTYKDLFELMAPNNVEDLGKPRVIISVKKNAGAVDNVSWNENEKQINFIIAPKGDALDISDIKFDVAGGNFDLMITLGVSDLKELGPVYQNYKDAIDKAVKINIDINPENKKYGAFNHVQPKASAISDALSEAILTSGIGMDKAISSCLLGGILWKTEGLRYGVQDIMTFKNITSLMSNGANYSQIVKSIFGNLNTEQLQLLGRIISKSKVYSDKVIGATLTKEDMHDLNIHEIISPEVNVLSHFKSDSSFVIAAHNQDEVWGTVLNTARNINLVKALEQFNAIGRADRVSFITKGSLSEVEIRLMNQLKSSTEQKSAGDVQAEKSGVEEVKKNNIAPSQVKESKPEVKQTEIRANVSQQINEDPLKKADKLPEPAFKPMNQTFGGDMGYSAPFSMPMNQSFEPLPKAKNK